MGESVLTTPFPRGERGLQAGSVPLRDLATEFGTPLYVYDADVVRERFRLLTDSFSRLSLLIAYSVKANGSLGILRLLGSLGAGADIVSGGELFRARKAGIPTSKIVFAGVGKSDEEILAGLEAGILLFNVESAGELDRLERLARGRGLVAPVAIRLNPDVHSPTPHEYTRTGHADSKFGVSPEETLRLYRRIASSEHLDARGIDVHIGSQISSLEPHLTALDEALRLLDVLASEGVRLKYLDLGGGFGVSYDERYEEMPVAALADRVVPPLLERGLELILEPGRFLMADAGALVTKVLGLKNGASKRFVITDAGMTELIRPSHYEGFHAIEPVMERPDAQTDIVDVVGPICETGDFLARDRRLQLPAVSDLLTIRSAGAYGFSMASNYNARRRPAEVLVDGAQVHLIRQRETFDDLVRGESMPDLDIPDPT